MSTTCYGIFGKAFTAYWDSGLFVDIGMLVISFSLGYLFGKLWRKGRR